MKEGDRVGVPWLHHACGHCTACVTGWETLCRTEPKYTGYTVNGGFAEYVEADPTYVGHLPDRLDFAPAAPILCAGVTVYKGLKECDLRPGQTVVISGIGGLGHLAVQYARAMGFHVIAVDVAEDKLALAPVRRSTPPHRTRWQRSRAWAAPKASLSRLSPTVRSLRASGCSRRVAR